MTDPDALFIAEWERDRENVDPDDWADPGDEFWTARPVLEHVRTYARSVLASPWATLGAVLARVVVSTPPYVVLPRLVGGEGSLNLYIGIVGRPGQGKGAADNAGAGCILLPEQVYEISIGSGEGIAHMYRRRARNGALEEIRTSALVSVGEVSTLESLAKRQGSVLMPELRKGWMGEALGFANADRNKTIPLERHSYRLCMSVGIQPNKAQHLLDDSEGGLPQRFIWLPAIDPAAPDIDPDDMPKIPEPIEWRLPDWGTVEYRGGRYVLPICGQARRHIIEHRANDIRGRNRDADPLDAHAGLSRLKIAAALGLLDGHAEITEQDWQLSGQVMAESTATRDRVIRAIAASARERNRRVARVEAERQVIISDTVADDHLSKAKHNVLRKLAALEPGDWITSGNLRRELRRDREWVDEAVTALLADRRIETETVQTKTGGDARRYRLPPPK